MGPGYDDEERPNWREIDRKRDRSSHVSRDRTDQKKKSSSGSSWLQKQYRKEAEKLFMGKKGSDKHKADHSAIYQSHGTSRFTLAVATYIDEYGLPDDWSTLSLLLDYHDSSVVRHVIDALKGQYETKNAVEKQGFRSKLEILAMTTRDEDFKEFVEGVLVEL
jgi:hypothetical protein